MVLCICKPSHSFLSTISGSAYSCRKPTVRLLLCHPILHGVYLDRFLLIEINPHRCVHINSTFHSSENIMASGKIFQNRLIFGIFGEGNHMLSPSILILHRDK